MKKAIVIGAGFGGIAAALRLRKKGYEVELVDRCNNLGGRAQVFYKNGFKHDAGPTLITAPFLLEELFLLFNKDISKYVELKSIDPWYRFIYDDGTIFDYSRSLEKTIDNIKKIDEIDAANYKSLLNASKNIYDIAFTKLADKPFHSFYFMLKQLPALVKFRADLSVYQFVSRYLKHDKLRRAFSIQPLLVGGNPFTTTSIYSLIHYLERKHGVYFAMGGTGNLVNALGRLMDETGIKISLNKTIEKIKIEDDKIIEIIDHNGIKNRADIYVSNIDPMYLYKNLIKTDKSFSINIKTKLARHSMGLFVLFFGTKKKYTNIKHHTILFGREYEKLLNKIFSINILPKDISIYLHRPTATDESFAPNQCDSYYALVPVPNLGSNINWIKDGNYFKNLVIDVLEKKLLKDLKKFIVDDFFMTPLDFKEKYLSYLGTGFSVAPYFTQSAWFRFHNKSEVIKNLILVGAGTHPGAGIPGVISSAKVIERFL